MSNNRVIKPTGAPPVSGRLTGLTGSPFTCTHPGASQSFELSPFYIRGRFLLRRCVNTHLGKVRKTHEKGSPAQFHLAMHHCTHDFRSSMCFLTFSRRSKTSSLLLVPSSPGRSHRQRAEDQRLKNFANLATVGSPHTHTKNEKS